MNSSTVDITTLAETLNSTYHSVGHLKGLEISFYIIDILFGLPTHSYIIWLIVTGSGISSEFFLFNLSLCEIGNCASCLFATLIIWFSSFKTSSLVFFGLFFTGRPVFQSLISVERYLAVVHPVTFLKFKPLRYKLMCSAVAWIICLGSSLCCVLLKSINNVAFKVLLSIMAVLFLSIQLFCCQNILRALKQSGPGERGRGKEKENNMKRKAFQLILIRAMSMLITYVPYAVLGCFVGMKLEVINAFWLIGLICFVLCGFVQPVIYLNRAGKLTCFFTP